MSGLFSTFGIATRGMAAQQMAIDTTAHNVSNANTDGYSRQRVTMETTRPSGMPSCTSQSGPGQVGTGVQVTSIDRIRDTFLDYQVRVETSTLGEYEAKDKFLSEVESILNEPSETGLSKTLGNYYNAWQDLSSDPNNSNTRTVVAQNASSLANALSHSYDQLEKLKANSQSLISDTVFQVNNVLDQIDQINQQIMSVKVAGNHPNDLEDKRDLLLDKLSKVFGITVDNKSFEGQDIKPITTQITSPADFKAVTTAPSDTTLVKSENNTDIKKLSYYNIEKTATDSSGKITAKLTYFKKGDKTDPNSKVEITLTNLDEKSFNFLDQSRVLWADKNGNAIDGNGALIDSSASPIDCSDMTKVPLRIFNPSSGEIKGYMAVQQDIADYEGQLDRLAKGIAISTNIIQSDSTTADSMPFFVNSDNPDFAHEKDINARNITVNSQIIGDVMKINVKKDSTTGPTDGSRALAIAKIRDSLLDLQDIDADTTRDTFAGTGTVNEYDKTTMKLKNSTSGMKVENYFKDIVDKLGIQEQKAKTTVTNQESLLDSFRESRDSVSGVNPDEETANLVQYQHAYQASAKIIATLDELLDVVVNGLKK